MKTQRFTAFVSAAIVVLTLSAIPASAKKSPVRETFSGKVVEVIDGNSLRILRPWNLSTTRIDLAGIEVDRGVEAKQLLEELSLDRTVDVRVVGTKGRRTARVLLDGTDLADALVDAGLASKTGVSIHPLRGLANLGRMTRSLLAGSARSE